MVVARVRLFGYRLPLVEPLHLASGTITERRGLLLELMDAEGRTAWGEAAPLPGFSQETYDDAELALRRVLPRIAGYRLPRRYEDLEGAGFVQVESNSSVSFAIEQAFLRLRARQDDVPFRTFLHEEAPPEVACNALLHGDDDTILRRAHKAGEQGFLAAKLKVGRESWQAEAARVQRVREALGPDTALRLDANRAFSFEDALRFSEACAAADIEYIEEPVANAQDLNWFGEAAALPYALDETLQQFYRHLLDQQALRAGKIPKDFEERVQRLVEWIENAAACVWKPSLLHVPHMGSALRMGHFPLPMRRVVLSSAFESGVGLSAVANYAAAYGAPDMAIGVDTYRWLEHDLLEEPLPPIAPLVDVDAWERAAARVDITRLDYLAEVTASR